MAKAPVGYEFVAPGYFARRGLARYAGVWSLWALGVGAVISGHFSGWNLGLAQGFGSMALAALLIALMYTGLTFCLAELSAAMPHTGGAYSFARSAMGPWAGFLTGMAENVEYVLTPAVIAFFMGSYLSGLFGTPLAAQPLWWLGSYVLFVLLNVVGVALSFRVTVVVTFAALACLIVFWAMALPQIDFARWALNVGAGGKVIEGGGGPWFPMGGMAVLAAMPFAVWLFLAIEQLPLAAEESVAPTRDMPRGILAAMATLCASAALVVWLNPAIPGVGAHKLGSSGEPLLDGLKALLGASSAVTVALGLVAVLGLVASFHAILFAKGRQIYSLSRAGYFPRVLSLTHSRFKTPHVALAAGSLVGLSVMLVLWFSLGAERAGAEIGATLLNMTVFAAMLSYVMQALSYLVLKRNAPELQRPFKSPLGSAGAWLTLAIAVVVIVVQLSTPAYQKALVWVLVWYGVAMAYFVFVSRQRLVFSPEEAFAAELRDSQPAQLR